MFENRVRGALCSVLIKNYIGGLIYKNEMGGTCGMCG